MEAPVCGCSVRVQSWCCPHRLGPRTAAPPSHTHTLTPPLPPPTPQEGPEATSVVPSMGAIPAYGQMEVQMCFHPKLNLKKEEANSLSFDDMSQEIVITQARHACCIRDARYTRYAPRTHPRAGSRAATAFPSAACCTCSL